MIVLTRSYHFPAAHILCNPDYSDEMNQRVFGKCANPEGHGHNYEVEVSVTGPIDEDTGCIIPLSELDELFDRAVRDAYAFRMLNDLDEFGTLVPTAENIARRMHERLTEALPEKSAARIAHVRLQETHRNHFDYGEMP